MLLRLHLEIYVFVDSFVIHVLIFIVDREPREVFLFDENSFVLVEIFCLSS